MGYDLEKTYENRFSGIELQRTAVWQVLTRHYLQCWVKATDVVLDIGAGYCEFINNIQASGKWALDLNPITAVKAGNDVTVISQDLTKRWDIRSNSVDVVFSSNFFEHLLSKDELRHCLDEIYRVLRAGGTLLVMGPNIRFCYDTYWDFFDHHLSLSDRSMVEALELAGFAKEKVIPRFLPFTMRGNIPSHPILVRLYLLLPMVWRAVGKQFLIVARKV
jgi:SAM-dependent methyltransferase